MRPATFHAMAFSTSKRRDSSLESCERRGHAQLVDLQHLRLHLDAAVRGPGVDDVVAADDDEVRVQRLRNAEGGGAAGAEVRRQAQMLQRILAVVAADGQKARRGEPLVQRVGKRVADPAQVCLAGAVVEGQHQHQPPARLANVRRRVGVRTQPDSWARAMQPEVSAANRTARGKSRRMRLKKILTTMARL